MNIIAIMGPHGVFYKDEPIKELESALVAQGFQIIWPQNSVDLLKFIEHNPRICGVIFDWDEYSLDLCSDINQLLAAGYTYYIMSLLRRTVKVLLHSCYQFFLAYRAYTLRISLADSLLDVCHLIFMVALVEVLRYDDRENYHEQDDDKYYRLVHFLISF